MNQEGKFHVWLEYPLQMLVRASSSNGKQNAPWSNGKQSVWAWYHEGNRQENDREKRLVQNDNFCNTEESISPGKQCLLMMLRVPARPLTVSLLLPSAKWRRRDITLLSPSQHHGHGHGHGHGRRLVALSAAWSQYSSIAYDFRWGEADEAEWWMANGEMMKAN